MKFTLEEIATWVAELAGKINAPEHLLPTFGYSEDGARPHIEVDDNGHAYYVIVERGQELQRDIPLDKNELLYKVFASVSFSMACHFEVRHRIEGEDFRRQLFYKQEELLGKLNEEWKLRMQKEHKEILARHPFIDK